MSKSAIKTINAHAPAAHAAYLVGLTVDRDRKAWPNADRFALFLLDTVANAYECENSSTFVRNGFRDMDYAVQSYVEANLNDWRDCTFRAWVHAAGRDVIGRLKAVIADNAQIEINLVNRAMEQARASQSYEIVKRARHVAANNFGGTIGEQEELHDELNAKGHYAAALLVNRFDGSRFNNHKAERAAFRDFLTKVLGELVDLDHTVALHDDLKREVLAVASHELQTAHNNGDIDLRAVIRNNAPDLVRIACRNFERCYAEDVNPLGYVIDHDGMILKIESVEDCIDGDGFINAFIGKGNVHTKAIHYSRKALVNWFMPEVTR